MFRRRPFLGLAVTEPRDQVRRTVRRRTFTESGIDRACRGAPTLADDGYQGTGLLIPHRRRRGQSHLCPSQETENTLHRRARARVEHTPSRLKNWKILRDCQLKGDGAHQAMLNIARLHNLALTG
ncbi:hypothetical protein SAM23877_7337 [Streptomyces ambofaciens ATCC 23877]|uniref:DDE Tnp4 domain-containing protein n=1 Tax=Streptomyces ambofaciens (strain ATCC 23877 / 3486 / DSM 40053 / JCM 4204 / NBRC 12836 / NRRL B-2516) TaxID=278992 RepID=A0A0K2B559_STRA7|nr:hypothetical protein SAM23877_7337 [Streptomyces ambofaciens ATCC 23877]